MEKGSKPVTINDVAEVSGVSYQTVSRVINDSPNVAKKTRQRVQEAIERLGYCPNGAARQLVTGRSQMVGIISFGNAYYGPWQVLTNIEAELKKQSYSLTFSFLDDPSHATLEDIFARLEPKQLDGVILLTPITGLDLIQVQALLKDIPYVMVDAHKGAQFRSVLIDQEYGAKLLVEHLLELGHRQICEISGPLNWAVASSRHQGLLTALKQAGLELTHSLEGDWSVLGGYQVAQRLLSEAVPFTALVVANDHMALGAYCALKEKALRIPEDISVIGFDDIPEAAFLEPPLTTVRQNFAVLGQQSVDYLLALMQKANTPLHQRILYPNLIKRQSTIRLVKA